MGESFEALVQKFKFGARKKHFATCTIQHPMTPSCSNKMTVLLRLLSERCRGVVRVWSITKDGGWRCCSCWRHFRLKQFDGADPVMAGCGKRLPLTHRQSSCGSEDITSSQTKRKRIAVELICGRYHRLLKLILFGLFKVMT